MKNTHSSVHMRRDVGLSQYMSSIYQYMGLGLALTALIAMSLSLLPKEIRYMVHSLSWVAFFINIGIAITFSSRLQTMKVSTAQVLFWTYAATMGISMTSFLSFFGPQSIASAFFSTALTFGTTTAYGYATKKDLSSIGSFFPMAMIGLIVVSLVNFFLKSSMLEYVLAIATLTIFIVLTAYETQNLKHLYYQVPQNSNLQHKIAIVGALNLYVSAINIFISLLRLFGNKE